MGKFFAGVVVGAIALFGYEYYCTARDWRQEIEEWRDISDSCLAMLVVEHQKKSAEDARLRGWVDDAEGQGD